MEFQSKPADPAEYLPGQTEEERVMAAAEERAADIRARLHTDMHTTLMTHGDLVAGITEPVLDTLIGDAMFQIEHLLIEIEALRIVDRAKSSSLSEPVGWPHE